MKSQYTIDGIKQLARTSLLDDASGNKNAVRGVVVQIASAQVFCHYISYGGTGEHDEYHWYVNEADRDEAFVRHLLDIEENPVMGGHAQGFSAGDLARRY